MTRFSLTSHLCLAFIGYATLSLGTLAAAQPVSDPDINKYDRKHKACLEQIAIDQEQALEQAMIWRDQGGGRRARHCEAMALFALGHEAEAAFRLDGLAEGADGGSNDMRVNFRNEAANFWIAAKEPTNAYKSATEGLKLDEYNIDLHITRARAHAMAGQYDDAESDLSHVLKLEPDHAEALRYRADARLKQDRYAEAKKDIEASLAIDPMSVETALLRGQINEAIRLSE